MNPSHIGHHSGERPSHAFDGDATSRSRSDSDREVAAPAIALRALLSVLAFGAFAASAHAAATPAVISPADLQFFENKIRPVLAEHCYKCHGRDADKVKGGLMLDTQEGLVHGGNSGAVIVAGKPDDSILIQAVRYTDPDLQMPPKGEKLSDQQVADLTEWVRRGAPDPRTLEAKGSAATYGGVGRQHWSFLPVKKSPAPVVKDAAWCQTPVDNFILDKLEASNMAPNPPADKRTLIRRVTFDLVGLPPSEEEVQAFLADKSPDAFATVVDRLLASPHYGERWGRYWMDVARYADTKGEPPKIMGRPADPRYPDAWTYRDYVINAFNQDKPFNQFILEQLAADRLIEENAKKTKTDIAKMDGSSRAALGFLTLGNRFDGRMDDIINDRIDVTSKAFLGLTVSCARCHDHKFDPIPQKDYYSLYGIFANTYEPEEIGQEPWIRSSLPKTPELLDYLAKTDELKKKEAAALQDFRAFVQTRIVDKPKRNELLRKIQEVEREVSDLETTHPGAPARANAIFDARMPHDYPVLIRGEAANKGEVVPRRFLDILSADPKKRPEYRTGSGRLELAEAIASTANPMTARVLVNRLWQQHFGEGFVATPDDLGNMSSPPTHPELLDYLAARFMEEGWSIKKMQRLIVLSSVYQESAAANPLYTDTDPDNKLHWRYNLRRLDFEQLHDSLLAMAGTLDPTMGGRPVRIESADFATRRAVYAYIDRTNPAEILTQFDFPNPSVPSGRRYLTIVPQQSLFMMNGTLVIETARKLTHRPEFLESGTDDERVTSLYLAIFQRPPTRQEITISERYVQNNPGGTSTEAPASTRASELQSQQAQRQIQQAQRAAQNIRGKNVFQGEPGAAAFTSRAPLDAWTKLAHALFQTNEAMFYD